MLAFEVDPELTDRLREETVALWTAVSNAGGAVGFIPPVTEDDVRPVAQAQFAGVAAGHDRLLVGRDGGGRLAAVAFFSDARFPLKAHWRTLQRVMVHPELQGRGHGAALLTEAERVARDWGLAGLCLTLRGGLGLEAFYERSGYKEVGRLPGALRVAPGDDRDEVFMWLDLG
jgi:GNAT superfamily N-acetyltransferase